MLTSLMLIGGLIVSVFWLTAGAFMAMEFVEWLLDRVSKKKTKLGVLWNCLIGLAYLPTVAIGIVFGPAVYFYSLARTFWKLPLR